MNAQELLALPADEAGVDRWLFEGNIVERWNQNGFHSPGHAAAVAAVSELLANCCRATHEFRAFGYGCPYLLARNPDTLVSFDASIMRKSDVASLRTDATFIDCVPTLAVEIVELDEDFALLARLVEFSLRHGLRTIWVVDPAESLVVVYRQDRRPEYLTGGMRLPIISGLPGSTCFVAEIFE
jgi:Uma2 family endonuclease